MSDENRKILNWLEEVATKLEKIEQEMAITKENTDKLKLVISDIDERLKTAKSEIQKNQPRKG